MLYKKGKKATKRITRRVRAVGRSMGLRRLISAESAPRARRGLKPPPGKGRRGLIRILLFMVLGGFIAYSAAEYGVVDKIKGSVFPKAPPTGAGKVKVALNRLEVSRAGSEMPWTRLFNREKRPDYSKWKPVAIFFQDKAWALGSGGVVLPAADGAPADLPVISFSERPAALSAGDTLNAALEAVRLAEAAAGVSPGLLRRISEIIVDPSGAMTLLFTDTRLKARLRPGAPGAQLTNLDRFLDMPPLPGAGTLDLRFGDMAYLKQEE